MYVQGMRGFLCTASMDDAGLQAGRLAWPARHEQRGARGAAAPQRGDAGKLRPAVMVEDHQLLPAADLNTPVAPLTRNEGLGTRR